MVWLDEGGRGRRQAKLILPSPELAPWVEHFWIQRGYRAAADRPWRIVADSSPHIIFTLEPSPGGIVRARCSLVGSREMYHDIKVTTRTITAGARLRAAALAQIARSAADVFTGRAFSVEDVFGPAGRALVDRMSQGTPEAAVNHLGQFLEERLASSEADSRFEVAVRRSRSVASLAAVLNISLRTAYARAIETTGLTPIRLLRIVRLHTALRHASAPGAKWTDTACIAGYADQAHMVREFRSFLGESPEAWRRRAIADLFNTNHNTDC